MQSVINLIRAILTNIGVRNAVVALLGAIVAVVAQYLGVIPTP